ncbi:MAG: tRNA (adenosine(37)-N6)-dimethylallyltransferase MiaA [Victivallales bacterium]|jgi:tRNA dimethylallyltransferase|nr:tRNA (adenosine(37)-N6)-dimethylallyltransferase MiaA [Victivallales bacterium]
MSEKIKIIVITGPTATGKTALAVKLSRIFPAEVVSVDSRQVYRYMDIGTGKDLDEYGLVPYHLIDIADPQNEVYNLARFVRDAYRVIWEIVSRSKIPILCGGTALYLAALLDGYRLPGGALSPRQRGVARVRQNSQNEESFTPPFELDALILGVYYPRKEVHDRIETRLDSRITDGLIDEVANLHDIHGVSWEQMEFFGLEYREVARYLKGECTLLQMRNTLLARIRQFAKRQDIFFRKLERENHNIYWLKAGKEPDPVKLAETFLNNKPLPTVEFRLSEINYGDSSTLPASSAP